VKAIVMNEVIDSAYKVLWKIPRDTRDSNPFYLRIRDRMAQQGGKYRPARTDRLSDTVEQGIALAAAKAVLAEFERERAVLASASTTAF
jgi:hypothetical protein